VATAPTTVAAKRLSRYFHPIARSEDVLEELRTFPLLGEDVLVFRNGDGRPVAFKDLCIHRGSRLSLGERTPDGGVRCAYHGWEYDGEGRCVAIPSLPLDAAIPAKARAFTYAAEEAYGAVWVALEEPVAGVPAFPNGEWNNPEWRGFLIDIQQWQSSAGRIVENFCDQSHVPWVHPEMSSPDEAEQVPYDVWETDLQLGYTMEHQDRPGPQLPFTEGRVRDELIATMPFTAHLRQVLGQDGATTIISATVAPVAPAVSNVFMWSTRNHHLDPDGDAPLRDFALLVMGQDKTIVESQRPELIPLDLREEMHLKVPDAFSIVYRRLLEEFGEEPFLQA
jgi:phenylpropionate dioxygenase-like ring-hydroxylating dioxygenase large terminal subunit